MEKTALRIRIFGDSLLRQKAKPVTAITGEHREILSAMARAMYEAKGIGLAAPQVGVAEAMLVVDMGNGLYQLINPKIVKKSGRQCLEEGCLSVPEVCIKVKRARKIFVEAQDEFGKPISIDAEDLFACVLQHEMDHLKGRLIVDYATFLDKLKIRRRLQALQRKAKSEGLPQSKNQSCQLQL